MFLMRCESFRGRDGIWSLQDLYIPPVKLVMIAGSAKEAAFWNMPFISALVGSVLLTKQKLDLLRNAFGGVGGID